MPEFTIRQIDDPVVRFSQAQAEVDVIECAREFSIEATDFLKKRLVAS
jgi:hypothetical protein